MQQGMDKHFDIVIIGGGPAGSAAAVTARRAGLTVALIDKAAFPRDKLCGGLVSGRGRQVLAEVFGTAETGAGFLTARRTVFAFAGQILADFDAPRELHFTMRRDFDQSLLHRAIVAGAEVFQGTRVAAIDPGENLVSSDAGRFGYGVLIGADGVNSQVARSLFGRAFDPARIGFALEAEVADAPLLPPVMQIDFRAVQWGYGWAFPKAHGRTIGLGGLQAENPDMQARMNAYLRANGVDPAATRIKGHFIPFGDFRTNPGQGNILLAGDAAGLVDPLTGEGIAHALNSGRLAAKAAALAFRQGQAGRAFGHYRRSLAPLHDELSRAVRLRKYAFSNNLEARFKARMQQSPELRLAFFDLLDGHQSYRELERRFARRLLDPKRWLKRLTG